MLTDSESLLREAAILITLVCIQFTLGKKCSFPYGVIMGTSPITVGFVALGCDILLAIMVRTLIENSSRLKILKKYRDRLTAHELKVKRSKLASFQNLGKIGVVLVVSIPCAGGVWSGAILSQILALKRTDFYWTIILGSAIAAAIFVLSFEGIIHWVL